MNEHFITILNMSLTASYVILFVILVRLLLKKAPKVISYASSFWVFAVPMIIVIIIGIALVANPKQGDKTQIEYTETENSSGTSGVTYSSVYNRVKIEFLSENMGFKSADEFETTDSKIVAFIDSMLKTSQMTTEKLDLNKNYIKQYSIELFNDIGGYRCGLYY